MGYVKATRQAANGRRLGGGVHFGEMERDSVFAHGTAYILHKRFLHSSDYHTLNFCRQCGTVEQFCGVMASFDQIFCKSLERDGRKKKSAYCSTAYTNFNV